MNESEKRRVWEEFQKNEKIDENLPDLIAKSWIHSRKKGVNAEKILLEKSMFTPQQIEKYLQENKKMIEIVEPVMEELCSQFCMQKLVVTFLDTNFCVLCIKKSSKEELCSTLKVSNQIGFCYAEEKVGTTAISMCVKSGKTETISGYEHYCKEYHDVFCVATPIYDENNQICAILGTTGLLVNQTNNLDIVLAIASRMITNNIKMAQVQKELDRQNSLYSLIVDAASDGMLTVDMNGIITFINPAGMRILGVDKTCIGKHITQGVDFEPTILEVVKTKKGYIDKEFRLESKNGMIHFVKTAIPMKDSHGNMIGVLDVFRSITRVKSMVNKLTGAQAKYTLSSIVGDCEAMRNIKKMIKVAGKNDSAVLIQGESGTGKEIIAQAIHNQGSRKNEPFIAINCAALPRDLIESELFGYEEGSFTGALKGGRPGKFEMAHGGTLFLDEIGDMPLDMQSKLLRVLQQKSVVRIGGLKEMSIDVRIIVATNKNLSEMIKERNFREDLYYRINVINIVSPPLRERGNDINLLIDALLNQHNLVNGTQKIVSNEAREILNKWHWPGNVRELENVIEYAFCMAEEKQIFSRHLPNRICSLNVQTPNKDIKSLKQAEYEAIKNALEYVNGNVTKAASFLGIGRNTLYDKMRKMGLGNEKKEMK